MLEYPKQGWAGAAALVFDAQGGREESGGFI